MAIARPMLAAATSPSLLKKMRYPVIGQPKVDGIRILCTNEGPKMRSLKPLRNVALQKHYSDPHYLGFDGELIQGKATDQKGFHASSGNARAFNGPSDNYKLHVFDLFDYPGGFMERYVELQKRIEAWKDIIGDSVELVPNTLILNATEAMAYFEAQVEAGMEGAIFRLRGAPYKSGRSTFLQQVLIKMKPWEYDQARIIGYEEQFANTNEQFTNELGLSSRSSHQENLVGKGTLGVLLARVYTGHFANQDIRIGTGLGLDAATRKHIWDNKLEYLNKEFTFRHQMMGSLEQPRQATFYKWGYNGSPADE